MIKTATLLLATALIASAHHSLFAEFEMQELVCNGTVVSLDWANPHASFQASVEQHGRQANWTFELAGPSGLINRGWSRDSLKPGDAVTIYAFPAKNGRLRGSVRFVILADGRILTVDHPFNYHLDDRPDLRVQK